MSDDDLLLAYYGDDLTGSTDAMEALGLGGVRTALFLEPPTESELTGRFADLDAVGVAGRSRSMSPDEMDEVLPDHFERLADLDPAFVQYKVCSTFDSAPDVGSIGHAVDIGQDVFDSPFVPVVVGVPALERYVVFGNLFATVDDRTYRIDRHPTMSDHPVTPMTESDLCRHLGDQTDRRTDRFDVLALESGGVDAAFARLVASDPEVVLFDTLDDSHLQRIGRLLWAYALELAGGDADTNTDDDGPLFAVGSSGLGYALTAYWAETGAVSPPESIPTADPVDRIAVMSGSASPETAAQIDAALAREDFTGVRLDTPALVDPERVATERDRVVDAATDALAAGDSVVMYAARGPDDPAIERTRAAAERQGIDDVGGRIGREQGAIFEAVLSESDVSRACIAGGDTSGYVAPALDIYALEFHSPIAPGCPLCIASSDTEEFDRLQLSLKGGQTGGERYFENVRRGQSDHWP